MSGACLTWTETGFAMAESHEPGDMVVVMKTIDTLTALIVNKQWQICKRCGVAYKEEDE